MKHITKQIILAAAIPLFCHMASGCHKEDAFTPSTQQLCSDIQVHYFIDGEPHLAHLKDSTQWHCLLSQLVALSRHHHIRILPTRHSPAASASKETKTFTTKSQSEAEHWIKEMNALGYTTTIEYDEETGIYTLTATK